MRPVHSHKKVTSIGNVSTQEENFKMENDFCFLKSFEYSDYFKRRVKTSGGNTTTRVFKITIQLQ